ncbi:hypothetical protein [Haloferula sp. BvORR071]|uniref:hypothetical protein n=1 Tax=Haloferula sp. BvORR071 TaxID=1396141 RepID=UPI00224100E4|nr:hypothetical protein [Haloferula sp. BvORR071]
MNARWSLALVIVVASGAALSTVFCEEPAGAPRVRQVAVEAKPEFRTEPYGLQLGVTAGSGEKIWVRWPENAPKPESLSKERSYSIEVTGEQSPALPEGKGPTINAELVRVRDGATLLYDASRCAVHGTTMERKAVPLIWGLIGGVPQEAQARAQGFPNTGLASGGCMPMPDRMLAWKWVCPTCKEKEAEFKKSQPAKE